MKMNIEMNVYRKIKFSNFCFHYKSDIIVLHVHVYENHYLNYTETKYEKN